MLYIVVGKFGQFWIKITIIYLENQFTTIFDLIYLLIYCYLTTYTFYNHERYEMTIYYIVVQIH